MKSPNDWYYAYGENPDWFFLDFIHKVQKDACEDGLRKGYIVGMAEGLDQQMLKTNKDENS